MIPKRGIFETRQSKKGGVWLACRRVSGAAIGVLGGDLVDPAVGHVSLLGWNLKVVGSWRRGRMKRIFFSFVPAPRLFTVCVGKAKSAVCVSHPRGKSSGTLQEDELI